LTELPTILLTSRESFAGFVIVSARHRGTGARSRLSAGPATEGCAATKPALGRAGREDAAAGGRAAREPVFRCGEHSRSRSRLPFRAPGEMGKAKEERRVTRALRRLEGVGNLEFLVQNAFGPVFVSACTATTVWSVTWKAQRTQRRTGWWSRGEGLAGGAARAATAFLSLRSRRLSVSDWPCDLVAGYLFGRPARWERRRKNAGMDWLSPAQAPRLPSGFWGIRQISSG